MVIWCILLAVTLATSIAIACVILPRMFLKTRYTVTKSGDRGIKKIWEKNGLSIVYEPVIKWRKYISQYVLAERSGKKQLKCKVDPELSYLSYDVVLFNNRDEVFNVLTVKEKIEGGYTKTLDLPEETSYVALNVNEADAVEFSAPMTAKVKAGKLFGFLFCCSLCIFLEVVCVKVCCANIFGGVFKESFVLELESTIVTAAIAAVLIAVNFVVAFIAVKIRGGKKSGWNK
jgi:hypothetical protein